MGETAKKEMNKISETAGAMKKIKRSKGLEGCCSLLSDSVSRAVLSNTVAVRERRMSNISTVIFILITRWHDIFDTLD